MDADALALCDTYCCSCDVDVHDCEYDCECCGDGCDECCDLQSGIEYMCCCCVACTDREASTTIDGETSSFAAKSESSQIPRVLPVRVSLTKFGGSQASQ